jgi:hypothetical protein
VSTARATVLVEGLASAAEALWYDTDRWPSFVDGLERVDGVDGPWPQVGGRVVWDSHPGGRGRVTETVTAYEARRGQESTVEDDEITAVQRVSFVPQGDRVAVTLELEYKIKAWNLTTPVVDLLFVRGAWRASLTRTLKAFQYELKAPQAR